MNWSYISTNQQMKNASSIRFSLLLLCCTVLLISCNTTDIATRSDDGANQSDTTGIVDATDTNNLHEFEIVTGPVNPPKPVGLTLGERLKKLDSLMRVAPTDSLEILMTEYERLLDSAMTGKDPTPTTPVDEVAVKELVSEIPETVQPTTESNQSDSSSIATEIPTTEADKENLTSLVAVEKETLTEEPKVEEIEKTRSYAYSTPRSQITNNNSSETLVQSNYQSDYDNSEFDPSKYNGVRDSELTYYREEKKKKNQTSTTQNPSKRKKKGTAKARSNRTSSGSSKPKTTSSPSSTNPRRSKTSSLDKKYAEGLAYFRAGSYSKAITELKPVASSSKSYKNTARYYYGLALERTGQLSQAASQYRKLKSSSGSLSDKAWVAYARVLKAQGKTSTAKSELLRFIKARPRSSQIASARELLQRL